MKEGIEIFNHRYITKLIFDVSTILIFVLSLHRIIEVVAEIDFVEAIVGIEVLEINAIFEELWLILWVLIIEHSMYELMFSMRTVFNEIEMSSFLLWGLRVGCRIHLSWHDEWESWRWSYWLFVCALSSLEQRIDVYQFRIR